ncbi:thioredoxin domain-containing protein [Paracraurococcus lichenis]|uniref:Thioredoxin domain-containing protein n=1 Tax=Paracraurococcus lichenis TaxID=3064888 RepID=A0ABT9E1L9_9PROT|nr:thioredoxin domain-containing protein [Paracraurococcus sp. LOR1-02]MDO9710066.1 thioredoxin domain-containing protein [Paracraurococcus sp. LOR1-02]
MRLPRRTLLAASALAAASPAAIAPALAQGADPRLAERGIGNPDAPVKVIEFFSLTCSHCAAFHRETYPRVKKELVDTGAIRLIWRDFPLDQVALAAAAVARTLPPERYEGFVSALFSSQDRWAFTRGDPLAELAKMAALAGMPKAQFDQVQADEALKRAILAERMTAEKEFSVQATPSFSFQGKRTVNQSGNMPFERFAQLVQDVKSA